MAFEVLLSRAAAKELDALPRAAYQAIRKKLKGLGEEPFPEGCVKLEEDLYRIRIGEYRAVYSILSEPDRLLVVRVARRSEKTYRRLK